MRDPTELLAAIEQGDADAAEELLPLVYSELRRLAGHLMAGERPGQTLQATALVHEAWLRLTRDAERTYRDSRHFYYAAATAMRRILIEQARRKQSQKRGGDWIRVPLDEVSPAARLPSGELLAIDDALSRLAEDDATAARLVELRFFVGLLHQEAADVLGLSRRQADGLWAYARAWLFDAVEKDLGAHAPPNSPE